MGKLLIGQRKGKLGIFKRNYKKNNGIASYSNLTWKEKNVFKIGLIKDIFVNRKNNQPLIKIRFIDSTKQKSYYELFVAVEGLYTCKRIFCGARAPLKIGNVLPLYKIPSGTSISNIEENIGDGGSIARSSGTFAGILAHQSLKNLVKIKLPSKKIRCLASTCRATIGVIAGGGRLDKPLLKAGLNYFKYKSKGKKYPRISKVASNPVDHPHGGGNHQHIGHPSTVSRRSPPGQKAGLIAARRTGIRKTKITLRMNL